MAKRDRVGNRKSREDRRRENSGNRLLFDCYTYRGE